MLYRLAGIAVAAALSGCAGFSIVRDYDPVPKQSFQHAGINWQIMDLRQDSRLMIRPPLGQALGDAFLHDPAKGTMEAVNAWFAANHRACTIQGIDVLNEQMFQYRYICT